VDIRPISSPIVAKAVGFVGSLDELGQRAIGEGGESYQVSTAATSRTLIRFVVSHYSLFHFDLRQRVSPPKPENSE
jgi:hypothetical protein